MFRATVLAIFVLGTGWALLSGNLSSAATLNEPSNLPAQVFRVRLGDDHLYPLPDARPERLPCDTRPWLPKCRDITPAERPTKPNPAIKFSCRSEDGARAQVECVLDENGMAWAWDSGLADCIITRESGWIANIVSPTSDYGLWQLNAINLHYLEGGDWWDPVDNTAGAIRLYRAAGYSFSPWTTHGSCGV